MSASAQSSSARAQLSQTFNFSKAAVVAIDSNMLCLEVLTGIMSGFGFRKIQRFTELAGGLEFIKTHAVDLLLIDPQPFGEDAYNFIEWMRGEKRGPNADVPVFIVTGHTSVRVISSMRKCGADYVIAKPFSTACLLERILWIASKGGRQTEFIGPTELVSTAGSGVEMW